MKKFFLPKNVQYILNKLKENGYEAYVVGGAVRDYLLENKIDDYDITTNATPDIIKKIFEKTVDTGIKHGTVTVLFDKEDKTYETYEVTTYRLDGEYFDGRHPENVIFVDNLRLDLSRRDFTVNAFAYNEEKGIIDEFDGLSDLKNKKIKAVGEPIKRFEEDALRMLRAIRFAAKLSFKIEKKTLDAIKLLNKNLEKISKERIQVELIKILTSDNPDFLKLTFDTGLAEFIAKDFDKLNICKFYKTKNKTLAYLSLFYENIALSNTILSELKLDNATINEVTKVLSNIKNFDHIISFVKNYIDKNIFSKNYDYKKIYKNYNFQINHIKYKLKKIIFDIGYDYLYDLITIYSFKENIDLTIIKNLVSDFKNNNIPIFLKDLDIDGNDIQNVGIYRNDIGKTLNRLLDIVHRDENKNKKNILLKLIAEEKTMGYNENYEKWLSYDFLDSEAKNDLKNMANDEELKKECFYDYMPFGTAGMRGIMGTGINRFNIWTVRRASQGLSDFIKENHKEDQGVAIIYDCRINSKKFALEAALNFCANGIKVYLFKSLRPTPFLSFAIRELKAFAGVNITASHNSKEYNGYKLYLQDGAQFSYPDDEKIIKYVKAIDDISICKTMSEKEAISKGLLQYQDATIDKKFKEAAKSIVINKDFCKKCGKELKVVFTPLHGTGSIFLAPAMKEVGFTNVTIVKSQDDKDGHFKTIAYPNPESPKAFEESLKIAKKTDADIIIATDPDADRMGVMVKESKGKYIALTGNELYSVLLEYVLYFRKKYKNDLKECYVIKSFVTTRMLDAICEHYGIDLSVTLTGFKWIGKEILRNPKKYAFGCEESYGGLMSDYVRDKDSVTTTLVTLEAALAFKKYLNKNLMQVLDDQKKFYGCYKNWTVSIEYKGVTGAETMKNIMQKLRDSKLNKITDINVTEIDDYNCDTKFNLRTGAESRLDMPINNSLIYHLEDNSTIAIRPSGTEPKIKIYYDIVDNNEELAYNKYEILNNAMQKILNS